MSAFQRQRSWAAVFPAGQTLEVAVARADAREIERQSSWPEGVAALQSARQQIEPREHRIVTAVRGEDVWFQVMTLPARSHAELAQMLELQMDTLTPLPLEEVVYGFEPLDATDTQTRVLVAIARKSAVNERVSMLETAGLPPEVVGVDTLAVFRGCRQAGLLPGDANINAFVQVTPTAVHVIVYTDGQPLTIRSVVFDAGAVTDAGNQGRLLEELQRTLITVQLEQPQRGAGVVTFATWSADFREATEQLTGRWRGSARALTNGTLPTAAASICLDAAQGPGARVNLLPAEWRERRRSGQLKRTLIQTGIGIAVLYFVGLLAFLVAVFVQQSRVNRLRVEAERLRPAYNTARQLRNTLVAMQLQLGTKYSALEVLRETSRLMPDNLKLSGFAFRKDQAVTLRGQASSSITVNSFIDKLEHCELFSNVKVGQIRTEGPVTKFEAVCTLKSAMPAAAGAPPAGKGGR